MTCIPVRVRVTIDPCGRILVLENEQLVGLESHAHDAPVRPPHGWHRSAACVTHTFELQIPVPQVTTPLICYEGHDREGDDDVRFHERQRRETPRAL